MRWWIVAIAIAIAGCATTAPKQEATVVEAEPAKKKKKKKAKKTKKRAAASKHRVGEILTGRAVWYGGRHHGGPTASGEKFDKHAMTAAHRTLPLGSKVRVTNKRNGKSVVVRINDRGPYGKDRRRIIDLSEAAARKLNYIRAGWTEVTVEVIALP